MKSLIKSILAHTPYRILRGAVNRFQAFEECFDLLRRLGYDPRFIVDGGAHLGEFALSVSRIFPKAKIHMIEPQPACRGALEQLAAKQGFVLHPFALASPEDADKGNLRLATSAEPNTGAHIVLNEGVSEAQPVEAITLDRLFARQVTAEQRPFLKLDLQGYELMALRGGAEVLRAVEVVLIEVSFFAQAYEPPIAALIRFLDDKEFDLFDVASLSGRARDGRLRQGDFVFVKRGSELLADGRWA